MSCSISVRLSHKELFALVTPLEVQVHLRGPVLAIRAAEFLSQLSRDTALKRTFRIDMALLQENAHGSLHFH